MASTKISRTFSTPTNSKKFTLSVWVKRSKLGSEQQIFSRSAGQAQLYISSADKIQFYDQTSGHNFRTNRLFRDTNAWYHIVVAVDTTQSTASNRNKIYINGVQETSFEVESNANINNDTAYNISGITYDIGAYNNAYYWDGYMSHFHFIDGTMYDASSFGSTDSTTGEWKINTVPSVTYGNNGFFILKDGNSVTDQSGNSNNGTASGNLTKSEDNPSNVFATFNPLMIPSGMQYQNGNTSIRPQANSVDFQGASTLAFASGKWYAEFKYLENDGHQMFGISTTKGCAENKRNDEYVGETASGVSIYGSNGNIYENNSTTSYGSGFANNAIIMMAVDADNNKIYFGSNGTWYNSGNPSTGTNGYSYNATNLAGFKYIVSSNGGVGYDNVDANFGNGYFGTTAISSEGTNASGLGKFEYDVPTGFTALCTKGLNE